MQRNWSATLQTAVASVDERSVSCLMFRVTVSSNRFIVRRQGGAPIEMRWKRDPPRVDAWTMLQAMLKQCSSSAWSMPQAMLKHAEGYPVRVVRTTYGEREQIMCGCGQSCGSTGLIFESKVCRWSGLSRSA